MYFWNYHALARDFRQGRVSARERFKYLLAIMIYVPTGLMGSNWIPGIYRFIYSMSNSILAKQASRVPPLKIFNDYNYLTDILIIAITALGIALCYWTNRKGDSKKFIERFMCLSIPISIRISFYVLFIFLAILGASLGYFYSKLQMIAQMHGFLKAFTQLKRLKQLMPVMAFISHRIHIVASVLAVVSIIWSFFLLRKEIKYISQKKIEERQ
jgi:uncharacterized membrane protein